MRHYVLYDRDGHVVWDSMAAGQETHGFFSETPREQAKACAEAAKRWSAIVDLMLDGQRLTGGGRVVRL